MKLARCAWVAALVFFAAACSSDGGSSTTVCSADEPVQCYSPDNQLVGCCPLGNDCSSDGTQCIPSGTGGSAGAGTGGAAGGTGGVGASGGAGGGNGGSGGGVGGSGGAGGSGGGVGGSGGVGGTGGAGGTGGVGGAPSCDDPGFEPNESEATAVDFGTIDDCDGSGSSVSAKLDGPSDADFYTYFGTDVGGCLVDATAVTGANVRLCVFATCSGSSISCNQGSPSTSPAGHQGCCVTSGGTVSLGVNCSGFSDDADVYVRVDQGGNACTPYTVDFHY